MQHCYLQLLWQSCQQTWIIASFCPFRLLMHFYCKEVSKEEFLKIEQVTSFKIWWSSLQLLLPEGIGCKRIRNRDSWTYASSALHKAEKQVYMLSGRQYFLGKVSPVIHSFFRGGLPMFLKNHFAGNARENLLLALKVNIFKNCRKRSFFVSFWLKCFHFPFRHEEFWKKHISRRH